MFLLLIAVVHVTNLPYPDCSFVDFWQLLLFCVVVPWVLRIWESFFNFQVFFALHSSPTFGTTCFYQGFPGSRQFFIEGCRASHWGSKQTWPICLFGSNNVQQKVLACSFYLCVKALWNIISTFPRFWTHFLIVICMVKRTFYPLGHRSS